MICINFNGHAILVTIFIIPVLLCLVFEHETIHTVRMLVVFDFYCRKKACNPTERENL